MDALEARDKAEQRLLRANEACYAWKTIADQAGLNTQANGHMPQVATPEVPTASLATPPVQKPGVYVGSNPQRRGIRTPVSDPELHNKAAFVRTAIEASGTHGISPADIKKAAIGAGIEIYNGYPYTVLFRLKEQGKVSVKSNGNYVAAT